MWRLAWIAEVGLGGIEVLHEVIPCTPLPDDVGAACCVGHQLDDALTPEFTAFEQVGVAASVYRGDRIDAFPRDGEYCSGIGQCKIVVQTTRGIVEGIIPQNGVVP